MKLDLVARAARVKQTPPLQDGTGVLCEKHWRDAGGLRLVDHFDFSSAIPEMPKSVKRARFRPISRPDGSYHS